MAPVKILLSCPMSSSSVTKGSGLMVYHVNTCLRIVHTSSTWGSCWGRRMRFRKCRGDVSTCTSARVVQATLRAIKTLMETPSCGCPALRRSKTVRHEGANSYFIRVLQATTESSTCITFRCSCKIWNALFKEGTHEPSVLSDPPRNQ